MKTVHMFVKVSIEVEDIFTPEECAEWILDCYPRDVVAEVLPSMGLFIDDKEIDVGWN